MNGWFWAGALAKEKWPEISSQNTFVVPCTKMALAVPLMDSGDGLWERVKWVSLDEAMSHPPEVRQENITLHRIQGAGPIIAMGYGPESDVLAIRLDGQPERS